MQKLTLTILGSSFIFPLQVKSVQCPGPGCYTRDILKIWKHFRKSDTYNSDSVWERMDACFKRKSTTTVDLWNVTDTFWEGFIQYGVQGNLNGSDPWNGVQGFMEDNPTPLMSIDDLQSVSNIDPGTADILIHEPCNSVSNLAYIRTMLEICEYDENRQWFLDDSTVVGLVQAMNFITLGSTLFHASGTATGFYLDNEGIRLFALLMLQGALRTIPYNPVLFDLSPSPRPYTGQNATETANRVIMNDPIEKWHTKIAGLKTEK